MAEIKNLRFFFAIMLCIANMIIYGCKVNINVAIIGMVKAQPPEADTSSNECGFGAVETVSEFDGPFDWTSAEQGLVKSLYFAGYLTGMFPAGFSADRMNAKWGLVACVLCNALLTLAVPIAASSINVLLVLRYVTGLLSAANLPLVNVLVGKWTVFEEKSMWVGIIYAGTSIGTVISILTSGWIMRYLGWEMIFYIHGLLPLIWCVVFVLIFSDAPETQQFMSQEERTKLVTSYGHRGPNVAKVVIPWKAIFTSPPFLALIVTNFCANFGWYFLLTEMPLFMNKMLKYNITSNATITCVPYLVNAFTNSALGKFLDFGRRKGWWTQTGARKIAVTISTIPGSILLLAIGYIGCHREAAVFLLCLSIVVSGAIFVGHLCNHIDLAPNYAGVLMGITNTPGTISAVILPNIVGYLVQTGHTFANWRFAFWIVALQQFAGFIVFMLFGSGQIQPWNYPDGVIPPGAIK